MKITIGIPHHRSIEPIRRLIDGLNNQKTNFLDLKNEVEIIIVNDGKESITSKADFNVKNINLKIINQENRGVASARNKIIDSALSDLIFFLDDDCCPKENWLQSMYKRFLVDKKIDGVGGRVIPLPKKGLVNEYYNVANRLEKPTIDRETGEIVTIITANCGFRTKALHNIRGFDQKTFNKNVFGGEDVDLTYRLRRRGYILGYESRAVVFHEYPEKFSTIFSKYANYGYGMKIYCLARNIDPKSIRQPRLNIVSCIIYFIKFPIIFKNSYFVFRKRINRLKSILFSFFDIIRYIGHGYGFLIKK
ncbi:MAG: glycosyltransferase [bacterium]|nr:glycosyltransferase [bacterium]